MNATLQRIHALAAEAVEDTSIEAMRAHLRVIRDLAAQATEKEFFCPCCNRWTPPPVWLRDDGRTPRRGLCRECAGSAYVDQWNASTARALEQPGAQA